MGDAADDAYDAAMRLEMAYEDFVAGVHRDCSYSVLGRKPCNFMLTPDKDYTYENLSFVDDLPITCAHCGRKFDYP